MDILVLDEGRVGFFCKIRGFGFNFVRVEELMKDFENSFKFVLIDGRLR